VELLHHGELPTKDRLEGAFDPVVAKNGQLVMHHGDVFISSHGGGGGFGDPLDRHPDAVSADVRDGYTTVEHARLAYGVVFDESAALDVDATSTLRRRIRTERIGRELTREPGSVSNRALRLNSGVWECASCLEPLGDQSDNWRDTAEVHVSSASDRMESIGLRARRRLEGPQIVMREHYCPACASSLAIDVSMDDRATVPSPRLGEIDPWTD
jgi:ribosomal protein L37AE/L43A